jgi:hypothetical protein
MNDHIYKIYRALVDCKNYVYSEGWGKPEDWVHVFVSEQSRKAVWDHIDKDVTVLVEHTVGERSEQYDIHPTVTTIPLLNRFFEYFVEDWKLPRIRLFEYNGLVFARIQGKTFHARYMRFSRALDSNVMTIYYGIEAKLESDYPYLGLFRLYREIDYMLVDVYEVLRRLNKEADKRRFLRNKRLTQIIDELLSLYEDYRHFYIVYGEKYGLQDGFVYTGWLSEAWETIPALYRSVQRLHGKALFYDHALVQEERAKTVPVARV